jgi:LacI family transcriptional regulator
MSASKPASNGRSRAGEPNFALKDLSEYLGLAPATVSLVMNGSGVAESISRETKDRIFAAAKKFNYRPNFFARCLRTRRSFTIGIMVPEVSEGYTAIVMSGIEDHLLQEGYFYFVASHRFQPDLIDEYPDLFLYRSVDGLIAVNTPWKRQLPVPVVTISSHHAVKGVTSIVLDHRRAAEVSLNHLLDLGHRDIAFIKGQDFTPDTEVRWNAITASARRLGLPISPRLVIQLKENLPTSELGYKVTQQLLAQGKPFTALFAFNDITAIGAIRALHERGLRVPEDVSVMGFDDIDSAAYQNPGLTTVRQPLREMGRMAAQEVLKQIAQANDSSAPVNEIMVPSELIVRGTTTSAIGANAIIQHPQARRPIRKTRLVSAG